MSLDYPLPFFVVSPYNDYNPPKDFVGRFSCPWKSSDLVLKVEHTDFHVHRTVLMVSSPVFERMLSSDFKEKSAKEIPLPGKNPAEIEQLLQCIYPDQDLWIFRGNCLSLLKLSNEYQIDRVKTRCEEFLNYWSSTDMEEGEALEVIIFNQTYPLEKKVIKNCVDRFVTQTSKTWAEIQKHRLYPKLEPEYVKQLMEGRLAHLEERLNIRSKAHKQGKKRKQSSLHDDVDLTFQEPLGKNELKPFRV